MAVMDQVVVASGGVCGQWRWWSPEVEVVGDVTATKKS
jgi:hypothetical protein